MAGSNFLQWNPAKANQDNDAQYAADAARAGGAGTGSVFGSTLANKLFYQLTTFVAAFAQMMAAKGYDMNDASLANLQGQLANLMTAIDVSGLAPKNNPTFTGTALAPNPPDLDDSQKIATTHWARGIGSPAATGYIKLPNGMFIQWITGPFQSADGSEVTDTQAWPVVFPNACVFASIAMQIGNFSTATDNWYQLVSFNRNNVSYQRQHSDNGSYQQQTRALILGIGY